jgi:chromosome segregation ATPase
MDCPASSGLPIVAIIEPQTMAAACLPPKGEAMTDRSAYVDKLKARLDQWDAEIDKLTAKAAEAKADARIRLDHAIEDLKAHRKAAADKAKEAYDASDDVWEDLKDGFETAMHKLSDAFKSAKDRVS